MEALVELRGRPEVPGEVQAVCVAVVVLARHSDDAAAAGPSVLPERTWQSVQSALGQFVNALRRFPDLVDSNLISQETLLSAAECAGGINLDDLEGEPAVQRLYRWLMGAISYFEAGEAKKRENAAQAVVPTEFDAPRELDAARELGGGCAICSGARARRGRTEHCQW